MRICYHRLRQVSKYGDPRTGFARITLRCSRCLYRVAEQHWWVQVNGHPVPKLIRTTISNQDGSIPPSAMPEKETIIAMEEKG